MAKKTYEPRDISILSHQQALKLEGLMKKFMGSNAPRQDIIRIDPYKEIESALQYLSAYKPSLKTEINPLLERCMYFKDKKLDNILYDSNLRDIYFEMLEEFERLIKIACEEI